MSNRVTEFVSNTVASIASIFPRGVTAPIVRAVDQPDPVWDMGTGEPQSAIRAASMDASVQPSDVAPIAAQLSGGTQTIQQPPREYVQSDDRPWLQPREQWEAAFPAQWTEAAAHRLQRHRDTLCTSPKERTLRTEYVHLLGKHLHALQQGPGFGVNHDESLAKHQQQQRERAATGPERRAARLLDLKEFLINPDKFPIGGLPVGPAFDNEPPRARLLSDNQVLAQLCMLRVKQVQAEIYSLENWTMLNRDMRIQELNRAVSVTSDIDQLEKIQEELESLHSPVHDQRDPNANVLRLATRAAMDRLRRPAADAARELIAVAIQRLSEWHAESRVCEDLFFASMGCPSQTTVVSRRYSDLITEFKAMSHGSVAGWFGMNDVLNFTLGQ